MPRTATDTSPEAVAAREAIRAKNLTRPAVQRDALSAAKAKLAEFPFDKNGLGEQWAAVTEVLDMMIQHLTQAAGPARGRALQVSVGDTVIVNEKLARFYPHTAPLKVVERVGEVLLCEDGAGARFPVSRGAVTLATT